MGWSLSKVPHLPERPHANAPLTELGRLRLARCVVDDGRPLRRAADRFQVAVTTAKRWADRYRAEGVAGMRDRSSRPHHSPARTPAPVERRVLRLRRTQRLGPVRLGWRLGLAARYEHAAPGDLVHVDVKKLGNIPRRRRLAHPGRAPRETQPRRHPRAHHGPMGRRPARLRLPAHRPGRSLPAVLHRNPHRRDERNRRRVPNLSGQNTYAGLRW